MESSDLKDRVSIQKDLSLGFKSVRSDLLFMAEKENSTIKFLSIIRTARKENQIVSSFTKSKDITFYPDSLMRKPTPSMSATIMGCVEFPTVRGSQDKVRWIPYEDSMI
jgi:hypothetical protein